jgi:hypothetical protein
MFTQPKRQFVKKTGGLLKHVSGALIGAAVYGKMKAFAAVCPQVTREAFHEVREFTKKLPVPSIVKKNLTKADIAFIAAAYAIPLPGTALFAAAIVGSKYGCRHFRNRFKPRLIMDTSNG